MKSQKKCGAVDEPKEDVMIEKTVVVSMMGEAEERQKTGTKIYQNDNHSGGKTDLFVGGSHDCQYAGDFVL